MTKFAVCTVYRLAAAIFLTVVGMSPVSASLTLPEVLSRIEQTQQGLESVSFRFVQSRPASSGVRPRVIKGQVFFKKPYQLRVVQEKPEKQVLVTDGKEVSVYMPEQGQALIGSWPQWVAQSGLPVEIFDAVQGFRQAQWNKDYEILFGGYSAPYYKLVCKPRVNGRAAVDLWISEQTFWLARAEWRKDDQSAEVAISDLKPNAVIPDSNFHLQLPSGTARVPFSS
jgi:outer membrane lipoprotein-sorting protein